MLRLFLSVPVGLVAMGVCVALVEFAGHQFFPAGPAMEAAMKLVMEQDPSAADAVTAALAKVPLMAFVVLLVGWTLGALVGGWTAARIAPLLKLPAAISIGLLDSLFVALNLWMIPHPSWIVIPGLALPLVASVIGGRAAKR